MVRLLMKGGDVNAPVLYMGSNVTAWRLATSQTFAGQAGVDEEMVRLLKTLLRWEPNAAHHLFFTGRFRRGVRHVLGLARALKKHADPRYALPNELWLRIIARLADDARDWGVDPAEAQAVVIQPEEELARQAAERAGFLRTRTMHV